MQRRAIFANLHFSNISPPSNFTKIFTRTLTLGTDESDPLYVDVPNPSRKKSERKPYPTPMKLLIRRAKQEKEARKAEPCKLLEEAPENGLLVPQLIQVARKVYHSRLSLLSGLSKLVDDNVVPVKRCRFCSEVHIGHVGHDIRTCDGFKSGLRSATHVWRQGGIRDVVYFPKSFHLYDRVGKPRVLHDEKSKVPRIPAIVELCIQAGLDLYHYPTRRRRKALYSIEGRIVDFDSETGEDQECPLQIMNSNYKQEEEEMSSKMIGNKVIECWLDMKCGVEKLMEKYKVWTCGYCSEVQVGPKGHKVRMCRGSKHQSRNGLHAWQEATMDDIVGPNYLWHVLRKGACIGGGAGVPVEYKSMMRLDVVPPAPDEIDLVT
ncbi:hypothetical protein ACHQM5_010349 [Ranunculus cassubicifolius]